MTFFPGCAILPMQAGLPRVMAPQGIGMRKVRASQGGITDNVRRGQPPGKCNRNRLPTQRAPPRARYRWKGEVKAHRHDRQLCANVNPIRCNTSTRGRSLTTRHAGPAEPRRRLRGGWRQPSQIDGSRGVRSAQNPAYTPAEDSPPRFADPLRGSAEGNFSFPRAGFEGIPP